MKSNNKAATAILISMVFAAEGLAGCAMGGGYGYTHRIDPYAGRENEAAMSAVGALIRPHSKVGPAQTEEAIQGLRGLGILLDLTKR